MAYRAYNPNPDGKHVGDCTVRAISAATGKSWEEVYTGLAVEGFALHDMPSANRVWGSYLRRHGWHRQAQLINGVQQGMSNGFMTAEISRANQQAAFMQQLFAMQQQVATCCCETREAIHGVNYNMATQGCETRQAISTGTRDIIDNQNANARAILDAMTAQRIEAKDAKIAEQNQQLFAAQLAASQAAQNETLKAYMSGQLAYYNPRPVPSFQVPAPYQYGNCGTGCGGCGC